MRSLMRTTPQPRRSLTPARTTVADDDSVCVAATASSTPATATPTGQPPALNVTPLSNEERACSPPASVAALKAENSRLTSELEELRKQMKAVLDHSIESDMRLIHYTTDVFAANSSLPTEPPSAHRAVSHQSTQTVHPATPEDSTTGGRKLENDLMTAEKRNKDLERELKRLSKPCATCVVLKEESSNMVSAIRCLEDQIKSLRNSHPPQATRSTCTQKQPVVSSHPIPTQNRFEPLTSMKSHTHIEKFIIVKHKNKANINNKKKINAQKVPPINKSNSQKIDPITLPFNKVTILGDSHARHLAGLIRDLVKPTTAITGMCKPGAGLLEVAKSSPGETTADHCHVLVAGSNDVSTGNQEAVFSGMEAVIQRYPKVIVCSLPHRHDLSPSHSVNKTIRLVNGYIAELCSRHRGAAVMDTNSIRREEFTTHGMHMRARGKRHLARMIAVTLAAMASPRPRHVPAGATAVPRRSAATQETGSSTPGSYAEAVKQLSPVSAANSQRTFCGSPSTYFLGMATGVPSPV